MNGSEVVATTAEPAFAVDCGGKILACNVAAERFLGYRRSELLGRSCWKILKGRDLFSNRYCDRTCSIRAMALAGEPIHATELLFRHADGSAIQVNMSAFVVLGKRGKEIVHILRGVSPREEQRRLSHASSEQADSRLSSRQLEVLRHLADGRGTREIAELLCIAPSTVRHHIQRILHRLRAHRRLEAVALARRIGLL